MERTSRQAGRMRAARILTTSAAISALLLPSTAHAEQGNWFMFGMMFIIIPTWMAFAVVSLVTWFTARPGMRPWLTALFAVPCTPVDASNWFYWPLWACIFNNRVPGTTTGLAARIILTALIAYGVVWFAVRLTSRTGSQRNLRASREQ